MTRHLLVLSSCLFAALVAAQPVQQVTITGRTLTPLAVGGFGDTPLARLPLSGTLLTETQLHDAGARSIADLTRLDASLNDAYNAEGYWSNLSVRGFTLDNRFNYRRDGLPIGAETAIALHNKSALEILKGTSGVQAGTSAPGGLVNFVVKRPERDLRSATLGWRENGSLGAAIDVSQRFGERDVFGLRVNAAAERLDPQIRSLKGQRHLLALAGDWRITADTLVEAELETSRQSQPSLPGFSLLGNVVPDARAIDPRINLNNQPWSLPVVFGGHTGSLRLTQRFGDWRLVAHAMTQRLRTDDRIAFPFGCSAEGVFDRYCSDGSFDLYDYRSENERRRSDALDISVAGKTMLGGVEHRLTAGVLRTRFKDRLPDFAFNLTPVPGRIDGSVVTPPAPDPTPDSAIARDGRSTELYLRDAVRFDDRFSGWFGVRHTRLYRGQTQSFTTPWLALGVALAENTLIYASWGQGVESFITPNLPIYANPGALLPAQKSRQFELGVKGRVTPELQWSVAGFDIRRPFVNAAFLIDGSQRHLGIEAQLEGRRGGWQGIASVMALHARANDGSRPPNVPARNLKLMLGRDVDALPGLAVQGWLAAESDRTVLPGAASPRIGGWARLDLSARYTQQLGSSTLTWRAGVDNVADRRAWKESPFQFGHAYLYAMAPRTVRVSLQVDL